VVERTFSWLSQCRGLARDYDYDPHTTEAFIHLAMIQLLLRRLTKETTHKHKDQTQGRNLVECIGF